MNEEYDFKAVTAAIMEADYVTALRLVLRHAQAGNSDAQCAMALLYEAGWGVPRDVEKAKQWLIKAAEQDNAVAWNNLGTYYAQEGHKRSAYQCFQRAKQLGLSLGHPYPAPSDESGHTDS
jgi:localization factor PodJL